MGRILVVDDERSMRELLAIVLKRNGHTTLLAEDGEEALRLFAASRPDVVIQDLKMPGMGGFELLERFKVLAPRVPIIVITAFATWDNTAEAMRLGAYGYVKKPFDNDEIRQTVEGAIQRSRILEETGEIDELPEFANLIGNSQGMRGVLDVVRRTAPTESTILIQGESGTGKELVARMCHYLSPRASRPFVAVNCTAFSESLLESELFGHRRGTFTGAISDKKGLFKVADGGTFFLDEIGDMPLTTQVKILRVLEEREYFPLGATRSERVDVRFVCATNKDLTEEVKRERFRRDLFFRINVIPVVLPPLRERREDIPLLAGHFVRKHAKRLRRKITGVAPEVQERLQRYSWPGNVRELENILQRSIVLGQGEVLTEVQLPEEHEGALRVIGEGVPLHAAPAEGRGAGPDVAAAPTASLPFSSSEALSPQRPEGGTSALCSKGFELDRVLAGVERSYLLEALERTGGNLTQAARLLGISFRSMRYKVKKHGLKS